MERLTIALDEDSNNIIQKFIEEKNISKSSVIRLALQSLVKQSKLEKLCSIEQLYVYSLFLVNNDHIILDVDHWDVFFKEIGDGSDSFWNGVYDVGVEHQKEYHNKGLREVHDILTFIEKTNWYRLNQDSENSYTLVLNVLASGKFVEYFFKGFFRDFPQKVQVKRGGRKISIVIQR